MPAPAAVWRAAGSLCRRSSATAGTGSGRSRAAACTAAVAASSPIAPHAQTPCRHLERLLVETRTRPAALSSASYRWRGRAIGLPVQAARIQGTGSRLSAQRLYSSSSSSSSSSSPSSPSSSSSRQPLPSKSQPLPPLEELTKPSRMALQMAEEEKKRKLAQVAAEAEAAAAKEKAAREAKIAQEQEKQQQQSRTTSSGSQTETDAGGSKDARTAPNQLDDNSVGANAAKELAAEDEKAAATKEKLDRDAVEAAAEESSLPSAAESRRSRLHARFSGFMDEFQGRIFVASQALNDLTGYSAIEHIKVRNAELETELASAQTDLRAARRDYQAVNERRAATQREVTTLLARKDSWAPADLERFTDMYRRDHELEAAAAAAGARLTEAEATESQLSAALTAGILKRYHEEQVWSDRIRRQSTWGTWGLMAVNVFMFIILQFFAEPWKRRRLMRGIAAAETGVLEDVRKELAEVKAVLATVATVAPAATVAGAATNATETTTEASPATASVEAAAGPAAPTAPFEPVAAAAATPVPESAQAPTPAPSVIPPPLSWPSLSTWSWQETKAFASDPARWRSWLDDLYSERLVNLRQRDLSLIAVESAATGAALVAALVLALGRSP